MACAYWQFTTRWREPPSFRWMGVDNYTWAEQEIHQQFELELGEKSWKIQIQEMKLL